MRRGLAFPFSFGRVIYNQIERYAAQSTERLGFPFSLFWGVFYSRYIKYLPPGTDTFPPVPIPFPRYLEYIFPGTTYKQD